MSDERREDMKEMIRKFNELCQTVNSIKGNQVVIKQYLETQFGGQDLVGTPTEGKIARDLRELNEKVKIQNGRVGKSETAIQAFDKLNLPDVVRTVEKLVNWKWYILGITVACTFIITLVVNYHK